MRLLDLRENAKIAGGVTLTYSFDLPSDPSLEAWIQQQAQDEAVAEFDADVDASWASFMSEYNALVDEILNEILSSSSGSTGGGSSGTGSSGTGSSGSGSGGGISYDDALAEAEYEASMMMGPDPQPMHDYDYYYEQAYAQFEAEYGDGDTGFPQEIDTSLAGLGISVAPAANPLAAAYSGLPSNWFIDDATGFHGIGGASDPSLTQSVFNYLMQSPAFASLVADIVANQGGNNIVLLQDPNNVFGGAGSFSGSYVMGGNRIADYDTNTGLTVDRDDYGGVLSPAIALAHELYHVLDALIGHGIDENGATNFERLVADQLYGMGFDELGRIGYDDWDGMIPVSSPFDAPITPTVSLSAIGAAVNSLVSGGGYHGHITVYVEVPDGIDVIQ